VEVLRVSEWQEPARSAGAEPARSSAGAEPARSAGAEPALASAGAEPARSAGAEPALASADQPVFYYDLGNPECYLAAERVMCELPVIPEWEPVWAADVVEVSPDVVAVGEAARITRPPVPFSAQAPERERIERHAAALGLQPFRWPQRLPPDSREAMLAATYAKRIGRTVAFSLAAFRQAFAGGQELGNRDTILIAGAACEMHPSALIKGIGLRSVAAALAQAGERARAAGVRSLPAIRVGDLVFAGDGLIDAASRALASGAAG
jgi:2-hydroxychromene-2-carboxylate isomerase